MRFENTLFLKCENMYFKSVKHVKNVRVKQFWSFVLFSNVFAPGSHCFAIGKLNRSAICTVHFRSIWTAPLRFSTCRSWLGRQQSNCSKTGPNKIKPEETISRVPATFPTGFSNVFFPHVGHMFWHVCHIFSKCIFKTHFFHLFSKCNFKTRFCETCRKNAFWKYAWKKCGKIKHVKQMWKMWTKDNEKFLFLSPIFPFFQI